MTMTVVAVIFGVFAIALIVLLIYNSTLTMRRDEQLFLDDASSHMHDEQTELMAKVNRLTNHPGARVQHRVCGIPDGARGDVAQKQR
jgi:Tfp pilus assembly protein PilN